MVGRQAETMSHVCRPEPTPYHCGACKAELEECASCQADMTCHDPECYDPRPR